jgi:hypothetical protein
VQHRRGQGQEMIDRSAGGHRGTSLANYSHNYIAIRWIRPVFGWPVRGSLIACLSDASSS